MKIKLRENNQFFAPNLFFSLKNQNYVTCNVNKNGKVILNADTIRLEIIRKCDFLNIGYFS